MSVALASVNEPTLHVGLPRPLTSLVGRESVMTAIAARLLEDDCRLLTLIGPGGAGKTRLAIAVADLLDQTPICFVDLSAIHGGEDVHPAIAATLGLPATDQPSETDLIAELNAEQRLLVLDNLEQISGVADPIRRLLSGCPGLTVLATSRMPVRLSGEQRWPVEPLALPTGSDMIAVRASPAVALFAARARLVQPMFALTAENATDIAALCAHLDGLPLAIELAAARMAILSPKALLARLENRLTLLASDALDVPDRQQTMRATVAWSYGLLAPGDQALFRRLSMFVGGFAGEAMDTILGSNGTDAIARLVDASLVATTTDGRYRMLESIRQFGQEEVERAGEQAAAGDALVTWALAFSRRHGEIPAGSDKAEWLAALAREEP